MRTCFTITIRERDVLASVDDATFAIFRQACNDVVELKAYNKAESDFQSKVEEMRSELMRVQGANEQRIYRHRLHICEQILTLKCPWRDCGSAVLDFDGCVRFHAFYRRLIHVQQVLCCEMQLRLRILWLVHGRLRAGRSPAREAVPQQAFVRVTRSSSAETRWCRPRRSVALYVRLRDVCLPKPRRV